MTTPTGNMPSVPLPRSTPLTPGPAIPGKRPQDSELEFEMGRLKSSMARLQKQISGVNGQIAKLKGKTDKRSKARLAALNTQLKAYTAQLKSTSEKYTNTQNKHYEETGQYDKLLKGTNRDAFMAIKALFKSYGLETLAGKIYDYVKNGYSADTISILLQDTPEYKARFAGNEARIKAGLPVLSAGEYLATEASYRQIMESAGMPIGFYDQSSDFVKWIEKNVSPSEIQSRVDLATQATVLAPANYRQALQQMGISQSEMAAYFLDPTKALPYLQKSAATAAVGAEALQQGLAFDQSYSEQLAMQGVTGAQAQQGYAQVAGELGTMQGLGAMYGEQWDQRTSEEAVFNQSADATSKQRKLLSQERGAFAGASGGAKAGLGSRGGAK